MNMPRCRSITSNPVVMSLAPRRRCEGRHHSWFGGLRARRRVGQIRGGSAEPQQGVAADGLIAARKFAAGDVGFLLIDRGTGATLAAQAADSLFVPASVSKLATAYAAISILGADHAFETLVSRRGDEL